MYYLPVLYIGCLRKILEEATMVLKEKQKSIGSYLEYCRMQISSFAKSELCTATSIQLVEQWTSIQMLWRERGKMPLINEAVKGVNACWQEPAWVIYCVQILCKRIPSSNCFREKGMELMWPICVKCNLLPIQNKHIEKGFISTGCIERIIDYFLIA